MKILVGFHRRGYGWSAAKDWSNCGFWYLWLAWNHFLKDNEGQLDSCVPVLGSLRVSVSWGILIRSVSWGYPSPADLWVSLSLSVQLPPLQYSDLRTKGLGLLGFSAISLSQGTDQGPSRRNWRHSGLVSSPGFLSLIGRCLPLSWKLLFYMFCLVFLIVSDRRVILVPIISPWPEAEGQVRWYFIEYIWTPCWIIVTVFSPSRGYCCACSVVSHSLDCSLPVPLFMGFLRQEYL